jgi:autotransporter-associated beta strand protein
MIVSGGGSVKRGARRARLMAVASAAFLFWTLAPGAAHADTCTWSGAGASNLWSLAANWTCNGSHVVPEDGDTLVFPATGTQFANTNDLTDLVVQALTIEDQQYQLSGNSIYLNQHLTASLSVAGTPSVSLPVTLNQPNVQIIVSGVGGAELSVTGPITSEPGATLIKSGAGVLTLSNPANSWVFASIDAGVLRLGAAGALPDSAALAGTVNGTLDLNGFDETIGSLFGVSTIALGGNTLTVHQSVTATFEGTLTGTGGLTKAGPDQLTLGGTASNTYTGTTTVTSGILRLLKTSNAQAITGPLVINGGSVTATFSQLGDSTAVTVNAPGSLLMSGGANSVELIGSLAGDGTVILTDQTLGVGGNNQSTVFSGTIGGVTAFLTKHGTGTLTLTGNNNTLDGTTFISGGGGLIVNGLISSNVILQAGLLGGSGTVGIVNGSAGIGTIAPGPGVGGAGTGILTMSGLSLGGATALAVDLNGVAPGTGYDRLAVANQVVIGNASLQVTRGYTPAANTTFTIIDNAGAAPVFGSFTGLPQNSLLFVDGHPFRISYTGGDGNDVVLTALAQPIFSISDVTVTEGESGSVNAVFTVSTPSAPFQTVGVQFATVNGTATSPTDFTAHSGTLTFLPGTTSQTVTIAVHGDDTAETTETFTVHLSSAQGGATIDDEDGLGTIETDDEAPAPLTYFLAEGATGPFFDNDVLIANPNAAAAPVTLTFYTQQGAVIAEQRTIPGHTRVTIHVDQLPGLEAASASVQVRSNNGLPLTVERTMFWDASYYGGHTGTAVEQAAVRWFFAEAAQGFFDTYVLVTNANPIPADITLTFLRENEAPVVKTISVGGSSRATIGAGDYDELDGRSFGLIVEATMPVIAERAMYFGSTATRLWGGGHESPGASQASTSWFHAEGATGSFFDTFILLGNPQDDPAHVTLEFLLEGGETVSVQRTVPGKGRVTVPIEAENDPRLQSGAVSTVVTSDLPIVSERSTYWSADVSPWGEGHNSFGLTQTATSWGLAEGRVGGDHQFATFILLANPSTTMAADVSVTYLRENGAPVVKTYQVPAASRFTIGVNSQVPELQNESFGAKVEVTNGVAIAVERSMYWNANGVFWAGGSHAPAQRLP